MAGEIISIVHSKPPTNIIPVSLPYALCYILICKTSIRNLYQFESLPVWVVFASSRLYLSFLCSFQATSDAQKQVVEKISQECATEHGITAEDIRVIRADLNASVSNPKAQVALACSFGDAQNYENCSMNFSFYRKWQNAFSPESVSLTAMEI